MFFNVILIFIWGFYVFFLCKNLSIRRLIPMLNQELLEKILANEDSHKVPFGCQSTMIHVFENVLEEIKEEKPYATIIDLLEE